MCRIHLLAAASLLLLAAAAGSASVAAGRLPLQQQVEEQQTMHNAKATAASPTGIYIVQLNTVPAAVQAAQRGSGSGPAATAAAAGAVAAQAQAVAARTLGASAATKTAATYRYAFAGFAASGLTPGELQRLKTDPAVAAVWPDAILTAHTITTPAFLDLTAPGGAWSQLGGHAGAGEGVIIGVIDSGIWPEHPSFADDGSYGPPPSRWRGACIDGQNFTAAAHCSGKLVGCKWYSAGFGGDANITVTYPNEFASCRDAHSHGTHTASTAGGNYGVELSGVNITGRLSGMAPRARIAVYKVLWGNGGATSDILAAIDSAVRDGCDIISFSMGGTVEPWIFTPIESAFFGAAAAGVFVSASGGNDGPSMGVVDHIAPWLTTVAASTHDRQNSATLVMGSGERFTGAGNHTQTAGPAPLVLADNVARAGADTTQARLCFNGTLDPAKVEGKIVVCDRGVTGRIEKSLAVKTAGGLGMVLLNTATIGVNTDLHYVPTVHLESTARDAVRAYAGAAGASATLPPGLLSVGNLAPQMAGFSSRGPSAGYSWTLKPDLTAPGADILAGVSPVGNNGRLFDMMSGTSMSAPHVSGLAALVKQKHPSWSPMAIKSALMTTAFQTTRTGTPGQSFGGPFDFGAGHVAPTASLNPGLVLDSYLDDWIRFLCAIREAPASIDCSACNTAGSDCDAAQLNTPAVNIPYMPGAQSVTRVLTSVLGEAATFTTSTTESSGFTITSSPASFTLQPGASQAVTINVQLKAGAALNTWFNDGAITWSSGAAQGVSTRIPVVAKGVLLGGPGELIIRRRTTPEILYQVTPGFDGMLVSQGSGMYASKVHDKQAVAQDPNSTFNFAQPWSTPGVAAIKIPPLTSGGSRMFARFVLDAADYPAGTDLDMFVYAADGRMIGSSAGETAGEQVDFAGNQRQGFTIYVHGFTVPGGAVTAKLHAWTLPIPSVSNSALRVSPYAAEASRGKPITISLKPGARYLSSHPQNRYLGFVTYYRDSNSNFTNLFTVISYAS